MCFRHSQVAGDHQEKGSAGKDLPSSYNLPPAVDSGGVSISIAASLIAGTSHQIPGVGRSSGFRLPSLLIHGDLGSDVWGSALPKGDISKGADAL